MPEPGRKPRQRAPALHGNDPRTTAADRALEALHAAMDLPLLCPFCGDGEHVRAMPLREHAWSVTPYKGDESEEMGTNAGWLWTCEFCKAHGIACP